jgi:hypothetical protein
LRGRRGLAHPGHHRLDEPRLDGKRPTRLRRRCTLSNRPLRLNQSNISSNSRGSRRAASAANTTSVSGHSCERYRRSSVCQDRRQIQQLLDDLVAMKRAK